MKCTPITNCMSWLYYTKTIISTSDYLTHRFICVHNLKILSTLMIFNVFLSHTTCVLFCSLVYCITFSSYFLLDMAVFFVSILRIILLYTIVVYCIVYT